MATAAPPFIPRVPVSSSYLRSIGYDPAAGTLAIEFKDSQAIYHYHGIPAAIHDGLVASPSKGSYFHRVIKGKFQAERVEAPRTGTCPNCGDIGLSGCRCDDCGTADYRAAEE